MSLLVLAAGFAGVAIANKIAPAGPPVPPRAPSSSSGSSAFGFVPGGQTATWFASLPKTAGPARERAIFDAVARGFIRDPGSVTIRSTATIDGAQRTLDIAVMADALAIGTEGDFVRVSMSARTQQAIADTWTPNEPLYFCTSRIADLIAANAEVRIPCFVMSARPDIGTAHMSDTWVMQEYNNEIERARAGRGGLLSDAGKFWIASPQLRTAANPAEVRDEHGNPIKGTLASANYGFYVLDKGGAYASRGPMGSHVGENGTAVPWSHGPGGWPVWQNVGLRHNMEHADYSQTCRLVGKHASLDGSDELVDLQTIALDPKLHVLVSDEGPTLLRLPGIPFGSPLP